MAKYRPYNMLFRVTYDGFALGHLCFDIETDKFVESLWTIPITINTINSISEFCLDLVFTEIYIAGVMWCRVSELATSHQVFISGETAHVSLNIF